MACTGVSTDDFNQVLADFTRALSYQVVTITRSSIGGNETTTYATASTKNYVFFLEENRYLFDKEGLVEVGDAYILAPTADAIKRYDKFTVDSKTFIVDNVIRRTVAGTAMLDYGICFKVA